MQIDSQVMDSPQRHDFHILTLLCISKWLLIIWRHVVDKGAFPLNLLLVSSGDRAGCFISPGNDLVFSFHKLITMDIQHVIQDISTSHGNPIKVCLQRSVQHAVLSLCSEFRQTTICKIAMVGSCKTECHETHGKNS